MGMAMPEPYKPKIEWRSTYMGIALYTDESLPWGTVEFRDSNGNVLGRITGIDHLHIGSER